MPRLATSLLVAALTLPLVAYVAGVMATPEDPAPDRSRPVIIGNVDDDRGEGSDDGADDGADRETRDDTDQPPKRERRDRPDVGRDDGNAPDDDGNDDVPRGPVAVTPAPRDLGDDGVGDDGSDDDDESDDGGSGSGED